MNWKALLQTRDELMPLPWMGGKSVHGQRRSWRISGPPPPEHGWHNFSLSGRKARWNSSASSADEMLSEQSCGYLVGDRLVPSGVAFEPDPAKLAASFERVHFVDAGIDRFSRIAAGRMYAHGPLIFQGEAFPLGPEEEVLQAFLDKRTDINHVAGVDPALAGAFIVETWQRDEAERRRRIERERREARERERLREQRRHEIQEHLGDGAARRQLAQYDFAEAAAAALAIGGAEYLDHRQGHQRSEMVVRFRRNGRRFECTCDRETLRIIDAGICLIDHGTDERGDNYFTLESLPGVINQAEREGKLVVFRHA